MAGFVRLLRYDWIRQLDVYPDDAYYYLQIGWNWAKTGFVSFDGMTATNGFHPLWGAIVALVAKFCSEKDQLVLYVRLLEVVLHLSTAALTSRLPFVPKEKRSLVFAIVASCLSVQFLAHQGMESGIYALFLVGFLGSYSAIVKAQSENLNVQMRSYFVCGLWAALCVYSRVDASILLASIVGLGTLRTKKVWFLPASISGALAFGLPLCSLVLWVLFSKNHVGSYMMDSALAKGVFARYDHSTKGPFAWIAYAFGVASIRGFIQPFLLTIAPAGLMLITNRLGPGSVSAPKKGKTLHGISHEWLGLHFVAANCATFLLIGILSTHIQWWYIASGTACALFWLSAKVSYMNLDGPKAWLGWVGVLLCSVFFALKSVHTYPIQSKAAPQMIAFCESLPPGTRIGYFDAGATGFYVRDRSVVNLDGLVNSKVRKHLQNGTYEEIVDELGIEIFGQFPTEMYQRLGARKLHFDRATLSDGSTYYKVRKQNPSSNVGTPSAN